MQTSDVIAILGAAVAFLGVFLQHLLPARLKWLTPLVFSLDDERTDPKYRHRPAIAIALTVYNAGALAGIIWDVGVTVKRLDGSRQEAVFQARKFASDPRYVSMFEIEEHACPPEPIAVSGRETKTVIIQFEQRSTNRWKWESGDYAAVVHSLDARGNWKERTSFTFTLCDRAFDWHQGRVVPCQRWTNEALKSRDAYITGKHQPSSKRRFWEKWKRSGRNQ